VADELVGRLRERSERRRGELPDTGERRRKTDEECQADFKLLRDKVLLMVGTFGVLFIAIASVFLDVKNSTIALAALTVCAGLLGAPVALRLDERINRDR
jgi:hypothetical protein